MMKGRLTIRFWVQKVTNFQISIEEAISGLGIAVPMVTLGVAGLAKKF